MIDENAFDDLPQPVFGFAEDEARLSWPSLPNGYVAVIFGGKRSYIYYEIGNGASRGTHELNAEKLAEVLLLASSSSTGQSSENKGEQQ